MNKRKLLLLQADDYLTIAGSTAVVDTNTIYRINGSANRRNGGMTLFSPNIFSHDTIIGDKDQSALNNRLSTKFDDIDYYGAG